MGRVAAGGPGRGLPGPAGGPRRRPALGVAVSPVCELAAAGPAGACDPGDRLPAGTGLDRPGLPTCLALAGLASPPDRGALFWVLRERTYRGDGLTKLQLLGSHTVQTDPYVWKEPLDALAAYAVPGGFGGWPWPRRGGRAAQRAGWGRVPDRGPGGQPAPGAQSGPACAGRYRPVSVGHQPALVRARGKLQPGDRFLCVVGGALALGYLAGKAPAMARRPGRRGRAELPTRRLFTLPALLACARSPALDSPGRGVGRRLRLRTAADGGPLRW